MDGSQQVSIKVVEPTLDDFGLGRLRIPETQEVALYQPFEASKSVLGILAAPGLTSGQGLLLETQIGHHIELFVDHVGEKDGRFKRYRLKARDQRFDMEKVMTQCGCMRRFALTEQKLQSVRFEVKPVISVAAKTFGASACYELEAVNVSKTGMLILANGRERVPFIVNTLLEVNLSSANHWFNGKLSCLAKVVRVSRGNGAASQSFGICFIEFHEEDFDLWKDALLAIEQKMGISSAILLAEDQH